jgi:hypothetical protein
MTGRMRGAGRGSMICGVGREEGKEEVEELVKRGEEKEMSDII